MLTASSESDVKMEEGWVEGGSRDGVLEEAVGRDITSLPRRQHGRRFGRIGQFGHCDQGGRREENAEREQEASVGER